MEKFFAGMCETFSVDDRTKAWQRGLLDKFNQDNHTRYHQFHWRKLFGDIPFPPLVGIPHHYTHALQACQQSPFDRAVCLTLDGSGDQHCTVVWKYDGAAITPLKEITMPHSLGWFYAAITEYLGFHAYNCEYKVMGLAAYGRPNADLTEKIDRIVYTDDDGIGYGVDPDYIHYGPHTYSERFTDKLVELFGRRPRLESEELTAWHEDLAYATQQKLETTTTRLVKWAVEQTGIRNVCIGGGVGLNIKMNSNLFGQPEIDDVFAHPLCSDGGSAQGVALAACYHETGSRPERLRSLALGPEEDQAAIEQQLRLACLEYERPADICEAVADHLAAGSIVGWYQGRMEAGPRALGQRSIMADPRNVANRDKVNAIIKFREYWRPFCPSMAAEAAPRYFARYTDAPFMIIAFRANEQLKKDAPAIVHVDGTSRVQLVHQHVLPRYHGVIKAFERRTGVPVVMNTSFNIKGEPIVCSAKDALRTFWSTGLEVLAIGDYLLVKPEVKTAIRQEGKAA
jgi:carbamoyltransferase